MCKASTPFPAQFPAELDGAAFRVPAVPIATTAGLLL
jgi:hypothetical protein